MQITPAAQLSTAAPEQASPAPAKPVSSGVVSPAVIQAQQTQQDAISVGLISEFKDSIDNANRALAVSEAQRKVDINALNSARIEIQTAKQMLAEAQAKATRDQELLLAQMTEKVQEMQERAEIQINIARQMLAQQAQQTTPPAPVKNGTTQSPVVTTPTQTPTTAPNETDWAKLALQLGAAYLLLS
jgi:phage/plasmid-associated DNA primase